MGKATDFKIKSKRKKFKVINCSDLEEALNQAYGVEIYLPGPEEWLEGSYYRVVVESGKLDPIDKNIINNFMESDLPEDDWIYWETGDDASQTLHTLCKGMANVGIVEPGEYLCYVEHRET